jgi:hypothetical protein
MPEAPALGTEGLISVHGKVSKTEVLSPSNRIIHQKCQARPSGADENQVYHTAEYGHSSVVSLGSQEEPGARHERGSSMTPLYKAGFRQGSSLPVGGTSVWSGLGGGWDFECWRHLFLHLGLTSQVHSLRSPWSCALTRRALF